MRKRASTAVRGWLYSRLYENKGSEEEEEEKDEEEEEEDEEEEEEEVPEVYEEDEEEDDNEEEDEEENETKKNNFCMPLYAKLRQLVHACRLGPLRNTRSSFAEMQEKKKTHVTTDN